MPDVAERSSDIGIAESTAAVATAAQMSQAFLYNVDIVFSFDCGTPLLGGRELCHDGPQRGRRMIRMDQLVTLYLRPSSPP